MKLIVTGMESSGTKWMTELLRAHPDVEHVMHTSIPEKPMPETGFPDLNALDAVVWMVRYEPFRLKSVEMRGYNEGREEKFLPPQLYEECQRLMLTLEKPVHFVGYESLIGPLGWNVFLDLLKRIGLQPSMFPGGRFDPNDSNLSYYSTQQ